MKRKWRHLAEEKIEDVTPIIPLGKCFWPLAASEKEEIKKIFKNLEVRRLVTCLKDRDEADKVKVLDAALRTDFRAAG